MFVLPSVRPPACLAGSLVSLQGLPRTYNKDLQEDKEPLFDTVGTVHDCLRIAAGVVATMTPNADNLRAQLVPEMLATDLADYLVRKVCMQGLYNPCKA